MKYTTDQIENKSITAVKQLLDEVSILQNDLNTLDKKPLIDGTINVYDTKPGETQSKDKFLGSFNIQVKGVTNKKILKSKKYSVKIVDLKGYFNSNGCIYFVVYVSENATKVFYKDFQLYDINKALNTQNRKSVTVQFEEFPSHPDTIENIVRNSLIHQELQTKQLLDVDIANIDKNTITIKYYGRHNDLSEVLSNGTYTYLKTPEGIDIVFDKIQPNSTYMLNVEYIILSNGREIETHYGKVKGGDFLIHINNYLRIIFFEGKINFSIKLNNFNTIDDLIMGLNDLKNILDNGIILNNYKLDFYKYFDKNFEKEITNLYEFNDQLIEIRNILKVLRLPTDFNYYNLIESDRFKLLNLVEKFKDDNITGIIDMWFRGNHYYFIKSDKVSGNLFYLNNQLYSKVKYEDGIEVRIQPSLLINQNLEKIIDFKPESIKDDLYSLYDINSNMLNTSRFVNDYLLYILKEYDKTMDNQLLNLCEYIAEFLIEKSKSTVYIINYYQVIKRKRNLKYLEKKQLNDLKQECEDDMELIGMKILLEEKDVLCLVNDLSDEDKNLFYEYPISNILQ